MLSPQLHLSYDDLFDTICPTAGNSPVYSHWQALTGLRKYEQPVRETKSTPPKRVYRPEAIIIRDSLALPSEERGKESPMDDFPVI